MNKSLFRVGASSAMVWLLCAGGCAVETASETGGGETLGKDDAELTALTGCTAIEAEDSSVTHVGTGNVAGSGSTAGWRLYTNGYAEKNFNFTTTGKYTIRVTARGEGVNVRSPNMRVSIGGVVLSNISITSTNNQSFNIGFTPPATGNRAIRVEFTNDAVINGVDVNLIIDGWYVCPCHNWCQTGSLLSNTCGADSGENICIGQICNSRASCCASSWDSTCVNDVFSVCARDSCQ